MQIKIEPVKSGEVKTLSYISGSCFYDTFHKQNSKEDMLLFLEKSFNIETQRHEMSLAGNYFFFARALNEIAGYIKLSDVKTPAGMKEQSALEISRIYVVKDKFGTGVGKALMEFAFAFAKQLHKQMIWLGVWENNQRAINFYRKYGFEKFDEQVFMLGNDAQTDWLMKKDVYI